MTKFRRTYFIFFLSFISISFFSQSNLVPNPSFETYTTCPTSSSQEYQAIGWFSCRPSPDYFNSCASLSSGVAVPSNDGGFEFPFSGNGYCGLYSYFPPTLSNREAIGCKLTNNLNIGTKYFVSIRTCLSDIDSALWYNTATDHLGFLFSTVKYSSVAPSPVSNFAQVYSNTIIMDTLNWVQIFGSFVADSSYQYLTIGNFFDNAVTNKYYFFAGPNYASYYFIDDVCVSTDSLFTLNYYPTPVKENILNNNFLIYPNPSENYIFLENFTQIKNFKLQDLLGNEVKFEELKDKLDLSDVSPGIYFLFCERENEVYKSKIIKK